MDEDEDYVVDPEDADDEIEDIEDAIEEEYRPIEAEEEDDVVSDYASENEQVSEDEPDTDEAEEEEKKKVKKRRKGKKTDDWQSKPAEELNIKPYKGADKYVKARATIDQLIQSELKLTQPLSPAHFSSTDDYDRFVEDREMYIYNLANKILETETLATLKARLAKLKGPPLAQYTEEEHLEASRKQIAVNFATLNFKMEKRVKPLMNAAQPTGQGGREATLAAALLARKQLQEAAKWLSEEDSVADAEIEARKVKPAVTQQNRSFMVRRGPAPSADDPMFGPKPLGAYPPASVVPRGSVKDESAIATGYGRRIIEQRGSRELKTGLGLN